MATAAILDFQFMWIWPFWRVDSAVFVFCAKLGSNICYSHWDRRTYALDVHLMTSRELTSGFGFWSCGHLRMAVDASSYIIFCKINCSEFRIVQHTLSVESVDGNKMIGSYVTTYTVLMYTVYSKADFKLATLCFKSHVMHNRIIWQ